MSAAAAISPRKLLIAAASLLISHAQASTGAKDAVLLSDIQALTFHKDRLTTHRRVDAIPQIAVVGGNAASSGFVPDTVRCRNAGYSYGPDAVEWTCSASLPPEFKLGSTDVVCEGYGHADDPYVLKRSCGVELKLVLTPEGERMRKQGHLRPARSGASDAKGADKSGDMAGTVFAIIFFAILGWIIYKLIAAIILDRARRDATPRRQPRRTNPRPFDAGHHDEDDDDDDGYDPPPPYEDFPAGPSRSTHKNFSSHRSTRTSQGSSSRNASRGRNAGGQNSMWSNLASGAAGAAAGYYAGRRSNGRPAATAGDARESRQFSRPPAPEPVRPSWFDFGGGTGRARGSSSSPDTSSPSRSFSNTRYESTGFGGTRRR